MDIAPPSWPVAPHGAAAGLSLTRTAGAGNAVPLRWRWYRALARPDDYRAADSSPARSAIACNVRTVVSMSSALN